MPSRQSRHVLLLLLFATLSLTHAGEQRPFLWEIQGETTSYMFGTIHLPDERVLDLPDSVLAAFATSDAVYTEIPMDPITQMKISAATMLPKGESLRDLLGPDLTRRATAYVEARQRDMDLFDRFTIWAFMFHLTMLDDYETFLSGVPLDYALYQEAVAQGKQVAGLETMAEQLSLFTDLSTDEQVELLSQTLDHLESAPADQPSPMEQMVRIYLAGDLEALGEEMFAGTDMESEVSRRFMDRLLNQRNVRMADRIAALLREQGETRFFFAVGAAHFLDDQGLPALLRQRGFKVRRHVPVSPALQAALP